MNRRLFLLFAVFTFALTATRAVCLEENDVIHGKARNAIVYIQIHYKNKMNGSDAFKYGTAFFISSEGYALTWTDCLCRTIIYLVVRGLSLCRIANS